MTDNAHNAPPAGRSGSDPNDPRPGEPAAARPAGLPDLSGSAGPMRVLIVEDDTPIGLGLKSQLQVLGHVVLAQAGHKADAARLFTELRPDLVLLDINLSKRPDNADGIELARQFSQERRVPIVVISAYSDPELLAGAAAAGVFGYLIKPVNLEALAAQIEVAVTRCRENEQLRFERDQLAQTLETRKLVERAKGIFMKRLQLDEPEAHRRLQQESQKRRMSLADLAKKIIESEELLGGP